MEAVINVLIQALLGGAAGYITNEYAINMLFKSYTPLNIGGVIKKTRNEFIDNISRLVEDDLINAQKINEILTDKSFVDNFKKLSESFYSECLYEACENLKLEDIDGFVSSSDKLKTFANKSLNKLLPKLIKEIDNKLDLSEIITDSQLDNAINNAYDSLVEIIKSENISKEIASSYYDEYKYKNINQLLSSTLADTINDNTKAIVNRLDNTVKNSFDEKLTATLNEIYDKLEIGKALGAFTEQLRQKKLSDIMNSNVIGLKNKSCDLLDSYLATEECNSLIYEFTYTTIDYLKSIDVSLYDLLNDKTINKLDDIITETVPYILNYVNNFTGYNKKELEDMIQQTIDEVVAARNNPVLNMARGTFLNNVAQKYNIVETIQAYISGTSTTQSIENTLKEKLSFYLKSTTIGDIARILEEYKFLTPETVSVAIKSSLLQNSNNIVTMMFDKISNMSLENIDADKAGIISVFLKSSIIKIIKEAIIYTKGTQLLKDKSEELIENIFTKDLNELVSEDKLDKINLNSFIIDTLNKNEDNIKAFIHSQISEKIHSQQLTLILGDNYQETVENQTQDYINKLLRDTLDNVGQMTTHEAIDKLNTINNLSITTEELIRKLIINNLDNILEGSIKAIVVSNLNKLSDDELCDMAHDFIGRQLQPIMIFGGILGVIAGTGLGIASPTIDFLTPFSLSSTVTYGLVGYATNAIAINMLFRPYTEKKLLKNIPLFRHFALGYIVKNKNVLADSMSMLINDYLLNKNSVNELFDTYEDNIRQSFFNTVSNENYKLITDLSTKNEMAMSDWLFDFAYGKYYDNEKQIINIFTSKITDIRLTSIISDDRRHLAHSYIKDVSIKYIHNTEEKIYTFLLSGKSLHSILPEFAVDYANDKLINLVNSSVDTLKEGITPSNVNELVSTLEPKYSELLSRTLKDILPRTKADEIGDMLNNLLINTIESDKTSQALTDYIISYIDKIVLSEKSINDIQNGIVTSFVYNKIDEFFNSAAPNTARIASGFRVKVSSIIKGEINKRLNFFTRLGYSSIGGDSLVDEAVDKILTQKLPAFIEKNATLLSNDFKDMAVFRLSSIRICDLEISPSKAYINSIIAQYLRNEKTEFVTIKTASSLAGYITPQLLNLKLMNIMSPFGFGSLNEIFRTYTDEIDALINEISISTDKNIDDIKKELSNLSQDILYYTLDNTRINDIFRGMARDEFSSSLNHITDIIFDTPAYDKCIGSIYSDIQKNLSDKSVADYIDEDELNRSITLLLKRLSSDEDIIYTLRESAGIIVNDSINNSFEYIDNELKNYLLDTVISGSILSLRNNMDSILMDIHFDEIAREQIKAMSPKKIHKMFNSFLGKYFRRLMFYGLGGAVFGINPAVGIILTASYGLKRPVDNTKQNKTKG